MIRKSLFSLLLLASIAHAGGIFSIGHKNVGFTLGQQSAYGHDYTVMGINAHYFVIDNLSIGLNYQTWLGDDPSINQFTVPVTYHLPLDLPYRPYLGAFYSHTYMGEDGELDYRDYDSYGGRVGISMQTGGSTYVSVGWVEEVYDDGIESSSRGYPEVSGGISF